MPRISQSKPIKIMTALVVAALVFASCSGGGGGGPGGFIVAVVGTSFQGFPTPPLTTLTTVFRDEVQEIEFNGNIDTTAFGGLFLQGGVPFVFTGVSSFSVGGVPYVAFADQAAARAAIRLFDDSTGLQVTSVIIGIKADAGDPFSPRKLILDPKVDAGNPFGLPQSLGLAPTTQFDVHLLAFSELTVNGSPLRADYGAPPPVAVPPPTPSPPPSTIFLTGMAFAPDTVAPQVIEITTEFLDGADPLTNLIPFDDVIRITFSEPLDISTINVQKNLLIRNLDVVTSQDPGGVIVPVQQTQNVSGSVFFFTPQPGFGEGVGGGIGYRINVSVGENADAADDIKDLPSGATASQNSLANNGNVTFTTAFAPGEQTAASLSETFEDNTNESANFTPRFNTAPWNAGMSGILEGFPLTGSAAPGAPGGLGSRMQFPIAPTTPPPVTAFFSPFDDNGAVNNWGPTCNPNGGSRSHFVYLQTSAAELPNNLADSIELVEFGVANGLGSPFVFQGFRLRMSHTTANAVATTSIGLTTTFDNNFDFTNPQNNFLNPTSHPAGTVLPLLAAPITVIPSTNYSIPTLASQFLPYPNLALLFDFDANPDRMEIQLSTNQLRPPNLVVEVDIPPTVQPSNVFHNGNFPMMPTPLRRVNAQSGGLIGCNADNVTMHMRFTTVGKNSSNSTIFYDLGATASMADFTTLTVIPDPAGRPPGSVYQVFVQTASAVAMGTATANDSGVLEFFDRDGNVDLTVLDQIDGRQFVRLEFRYESNTVTNQAPFTDGFIIGFTF